MANLGKIIYLSEVQKNELFALGSVTSNGTTITYNENDLYITPDKSIDKIWLNGTAYTALNGATDLGHVLTSENNNIIAPVESSNTTSQLYNIGDIFVYNDQLYKATSTIATSTTITPNTNCEQIQVINLINEKYTKPSNGIPSTDIASGVIPDIQINGTSIVNNGVANIPLANGTVPGVVKIGSGLIFDTAGMIKVNAASEEQVKAQSAVTRPIVPFIQHMSVFYGLAKAAGDTTQSSSSNAVGTYTNEAKSAIQSMLGVEPGTTLVETVTGTTPSITALPNVRYNCGEVSTISITPPANGTCDIFFTSGSTAAVLTVPSTVKWPAWFDATALEADMIYEIMITDGVYGSVMTWES